MLARCNAEGPGSADVDIHGLEGSVVIEHLDSLVGSIADVHVALVVHLNRVNVFKLSRPVASGSKGLHKISVFVEFHDSLIVVSVRDENISSGVPGNVGFTVECGERTHIESLPASSTSPCGSTRATCRSCWAGRE